MLVLLASLFFCPWPSAYLVVVISALGSCCCSNARAPTPTVRRPAFREKLPGRLGKNSLTSANQKPVDSGATPCPVAGAGGRSRKRAQNDKGGDSMSRVALNHAMAGAYTYRGRSGFSRGAASRPADCRDQAAGARGGGIVFLKQFQLQAGIALIVAALHAAALAEERNPAAAMEAPSVEVIGTTPLPGIGTPINEVPANVQAITGAQMEQQESVSLPDYLDRNVGSASINEGQGNPFQPDVNFRGFQGSPLLGVPQGISVFQDGVRINEAFGDTINWDLIPQGAISSMNLIPGSNPVFGLNTLGGALAINTKSGRVYPGGAVTLFGGSFGTYSGNIEYGGAKDNFDYYVYGNYYDSNGWRDYSPSLIRQLFGKVGYETADFDVDLSYTFANNDLQGTQASPLPMFEADPKLAYTWPDTTANKLNFVNLRLSKAFGEDKLLAGNAYWRQFKSRNVGSNVNDQFAGANGGTTCDDTLPPEQQCPASNDASDIDTNGLGAALQFTLLTPIAAHKNSFTIGASYDYGNTDFTQQEQDAVFISHETVGVEPFETADAGEQQHRLHRLVLHRHVRAHAAVSAHAGGTLQRRSDQDPGRARQQSRRERHQHVSAFQSRGGPELQPQPGAQHLHQLQRGHARADRHRADLRRPERALPAAQRLSVRPAARTGDRQDLRARRARHARLHQDFVDCSHLPRQSQRRHPVRVHRRRGQRRLLHQRAEDAPARASSSACSSALDRSP